MTIEERQLVIALATSLATAERLSRGSMPALAALWRKNLTRAGDELALDFILAAEAIDDIGIKLEPRIEEPPAA